MQIKLTRKQLEAARLKLAQQGVAFTGDSGTISHSGVTLAVNYCEAAQTLDIAIQSKPFFITTAAINKDVATWFQGS